MAQTLSPALTNAVADPRTANDLAGKVDRLADTVEVPVGSANDEAITAIRLPVTAKIDRVIVATDDLGGSAVMDVTLYTQDKTPVGTTFTIVAAHVFKTGLDVSGAVVPPTDVRFVNLDINSVNKELWQLAGLSAKPFYGEMFLGLKFTAAVGTAGTATVIVDLRK